MNKASRSFASAAALCLSLTMLLSALAGCAAPAATPVFTPSPAPTLLSEPATPTASATAKPSAPTATTPAPSATVSATATATPKPFPFDTAKAAPLLGALAQLMTQNAFGTCAFTRYPEPEQVEGLYAVLLRDELLPANTHFKGITRDKESAAFTEEGLHELYKALFSEGDFADLPKDSVISSTKKGVTTFTYPQKDDLQYTLTPTSFTALSDPNYYEITAALNWAYPEDAEATQGGTVTMWVKPDTAAPFGIRIAKLSASISTRPGEDFGSHPSRDFKQVAPLLHAIASACVATGDGYNEKPTDEFAWQAAYALLNRYATDFEIDNKGSNISVSSAKMREVFTALFGSQFKIPSIPSKLRSRVSLSGSTYTLDRSTDDATPVYADYFVAANGNDVFTVSLMRGSKTQADPLSYEGATRVSLAIDEKALYRHRICENATYLKTTIS